MTWSPPDSARNSTAHNGLIACATVAAQTFGNIVSGTDPAVIPMAFAGQPAAHQPREPHYYRIQGPTVLVEYDNPQGGANHVHSVWRDLENDFGHDLSRKHYARQPHGR